MSVLKWGWLVTDHEKWLLNKAQCSWRELFLAFASVFKNVIAFFELVHCPYWDGDEDFTGHQISHPCPKDRMSSTYCGESLQAPQSSAWPLNPGPGVLFSLFPANLRALVHFLMEGSGWLPLLSFACIWLFVTISSQTDSESPIFARQGKRGHQPPEGRCESNGECADRVPQCPLGSGSEPGRLPKTLSS